MNSRGVAQLGSAPAWGAGGRRFKSSRPDHFSDGGGGACESTASGGSTAARIVPLCARHRGQWEVLFAAYADFYRTALGAQTAATVWEWLDGGALRGFGAEDAGGDLCAFAHWELMLRPLSGGRRAYLHDLFVAPSVRGGGVGGLLVAAVADAARAADCATLRWATAADNTGAARLYDKIAEKTSWVVYDKKL